MIYFPSALRERAKRRRALENLLSPAAMKRAARRPDILSLPAQARVMSFLVCRIRGFAELADSFGHDAEGLTRLSRKAMTPLAQTVLDRDGALDRILPGALSAFFNAPLDDAEHAIHACESALAMLQAVERLNRTLERALRADGTPLGAVGIGIGIATGPGILGDFGTEDRPAYTATGHAALSAGAIETLSANYGTAILVDAATRDRAEDNFAFLEVDIVAQEREQPTVLYALLGNTLARANPKFLALKTIHERVFSAYRQREWEKARGLIAQARALSGANPVLYDLYLKRIAHYEAHPPGAAWNGVFSA